jgi:hypothetical protein
VSKCVVLRERAKVSGAIRVPTLKIEHARLGLVSIVACLMGLGGCAPRPIVDGSTISGTAHRTIHARTVLKPTTAERTARDRTSKSTIPLPDPSLLEPQPMPDCTFRGTLSSPVTVEEMRMKLDYEQQCYRQAESITRDRLQQLQNSVDKTIKAVHREAHGEDH